MSVPHTTWAKYYDTAYEESFGSFYDALTKLTLEQIENVVKPPTSIVDFGAGTGRLSIPLASKGYNVVAVDPCMEMLDQLKEKDSEMRVERVNALMKDFKYEKQFDMALCVFTVLLYLLDEDSLSLSVETVSRVLRKGGLLLIDVPSKAIFNDFYKCTEKMKRGVRVTPQEEGIYLYKEETTVNTSTDPIIYSDEFLIRFWKQDEVMNALEAKGFSIEQDLTYTFAGSGSSYFLAKKNQS